MTFNDLPNPFLIAEIGGNHEGSLARAVELTQFAASSGAHAVKFQAYRPDGIVNRVLNPERNMHFKKFSLKPSEYVQLAQLCHSLGVEFMASLWDYEYVELLDPYIRVHKVGSGDLTNRPLLEILAKKNKSLCIATAMATMTEVADMVRFIDDVNPDLRESGHLCVMHCVAMYGEPLDRYANMGAIETLRQGLPSKVVIGYSDHTVGTTAIEIAVCMGAQIIEVHFTDDPKRDFRDHHLSKTRKELIEFIQFCERRKKMLGSGKKEPVSEIETEERIREFRRGVFLNRNMEAGEVISQEDLTTLRPNVGIGAVDFSLVVGRRLCVNKNALEPLSWHDFEDPAMEA
jgi:N-acetylneuraminate synthase/N,N'-diacetyllegionaminate synthase